MKIFLFAALFSFVSSNVYAMSAATRMEAVQYMTEDGMFNFSIQLFETIF